MFEILILVCASTLNAPDCQMNTALDVIHGPSAASVIACGVQGQAYIAETSLVGRLDGAYVKIRCGRAPVAQDASVPNASHVVLK